MFLGLLLVAVSTAAADDMTAVLVVTLVVVDVVVNRRFSAQNLKMGFCIRKAMNRKRKKSSANIMKINNKSYYD